MSDFLSDINPLIVEKTAVVTAHHGKRIRPALVYLSACACNVEISSTSHDFALLTEMIHSASLFHDDVLDNAGQRRGYPAANQLLGNDTAVLFGDLLYMKALTLILSQPVPLRKIVNSTVLNMIQAEILQGLNRYKLLEENEYFSIIEGKTAALMALACFLGASHSKNTDWINSLKQYGLFVGTAFQMTDDLLDWTGVNTGKDRFSDAREGRLTLPLIRLMATMNDSEKSDCMKTFVRSGHLSATDDARRFCRMMENRGVFDGIRKDILNYMHTAVDFLKILPVSPFREDLAAIPDLLARRKY